jgi:hypothetical protein
VGEADCKNLSKASERVSSRSVRSGLHTREFILSPWERENLYVIVLPVPGTDWFARRWVSCLLIVLRLV